MNARGVRVAFATIAIAASGIAASACGACGNGTAKTSASPLASASPSASVRSRAKLVVDERDPYVALITEALRAARAGKKDDALAALERLDATSFDFPPSDDEFPTLKDDPRYRAIAARMLAREPKTHESSVAFKADRTLVAEGIAFDAEAEVFFLGSIAKKKIVRIVRVDPSRSLDHVREGQDGLLSVLGMKVDSAKRTLWAAAYDESAKKGGVFAFDTETGKLRRRALLENGHGFNDLVVDDRGTVFATDSESGGLYMMPPNADALLPYFEPGSFAYPNGIALSERPARIFVAQQDGIVVIDRTTKSARALAHDPKLSLAGIDGLYLHDESLIAIQNGLGRPRVVRFELDPSMSKVERAVVLETENPAFHIPTTGVIVGNNFFYIANSQIDREKGPKDALEEIVVLRLAL